MTAEAIPPLKKRTLDGTLYTRPKGIEEKLLAISNLSRNEIAARCEIHDREEEKYIPSECLVHLVREHRGRAMDYCMEALYRSLIERVIGGLPTGESLDGERVNGLKSDIGDLAREWFLTMLSEDRTEYVEDLDIFEARFAMGLCTLRIDAERRVVSRQKPSKHMGIEDPKTGEMSREVEEASAFNPYDRHKLDDPAYVLRLNKAIDELEPLEKAIIELDRNEIPDESKDPKVLTISGLLKKTPKTIRAHRALALSALHEALTKGEPR